MLVNISYNDREITDKINKEVGKAFNLRERFLHKGIGSPKLFITHSSIDIHNLLVLDQNINTCNIELRPKGIIVRFRSLLETFALVIPYYKLNLYKGQSQEYSIFRDNSFVRIAAKTPQIHKFMSKILKIKGDQAFTYIDDLNYPQ